MAGRFKDHSIILLLGALKKREYSRKAMRRIISTQLSAFTLKPYYLLFLSKPDFSLKAFHLSIY
jgi:hypothetical protein